MELMSNVVEFRGVSSHLNKEQKKYFLAHFEDVDNRAFNLYLGNSIGLVQDLTKGDHVSLVCDYNFAYGRLKLVEAVRENGN